MAEETPTVKIVPYMLLAMVLAGAVRAEWPKKDYAAEYDACLSPCSRNHPKEHDKCVSYCTCVTDGMQARFADHGRLTRQVIGQKMREEIASLQKIANSCNLKLWGSAAQRLKF